MTKSLFTVAPVLAALFLASPAALAADPLAVPITQTVPEPADTP